jgi:hypothetical protein
MPHQQSARKRRDDRKFLEMCCNRNQGYARQSNGYLASRISNIIQCYSEA